jgi:hypothetical protein
MKDHATAEAAKKLPVPIITLPEPDPVDFYVPFPVPVQQPYDVMIPFPVNAMPYRPPCNPCAPPHHY